MAVTRCAHDIVGINQGGGFDNRNRGTYVIPYLIQTNSQMGPRAVANGATTVGPNMLPAPFATYSYLGDTDPYSLAQDFGGPFHLKNVAPDGQVWRMIVRYTPPAPNQSAGYGQINPLVRPTEFWWDGEAFSEPIWKDKDGKKIVNKAETLYADPLEEEMTRGVLVAEWNVADLATAISLNRTYERRVNSEAWQGAPPRTVLCRLMRSGKRQFELGSNYYPMSARFAFKENGATWARGILEQGYYSFKKDDQGNFVTEVDPSNAQVTRKKLIKHDDIRLLADDGTLLGDGLGGIFTDWNTKLEADFNLIGFP